MPKRKVYLGYMLRENWSVWFMEPDFQTSLPKKLTFNDPSKIREMAKRGVALNNLEAVAMLEHSLEIGRGGVWLELTEEQYQRLMAPR